MPDTVKDVVVASPAASWKDYEEESQAGRLARKSKEAPFMPIGLAGLTGAVLYGIYKYRTRGAMSTSVYLMQLRVAAQGTVVLALMGGVAYSLYSDFTAKKPEKATKES